MLERYGDFELLRGVVTEELTDLPDDDLAEALPDGMAEALEEISGTVRELGASVQRVLPGALTGAAAGFASGGAPGAVLGGLAGAVTADAGQAGRAQVSTPQTAAAPPIAVPAATVGNPAALELLLSLLRPEVVQALSAMALGRAGAATVPVGGSVVPVAAVTNMIQTLAARATTAHQAQAGPGGAAMPEYLVSGGVGGAEALSPEARADALLGLLAEAATDDGTATYDAWIDEEAERRDLLDIYRLGGVD